MKKKMDIAVGLYVVVIFLYFLYIQFTDATLQQHALTLLFSGGLVLNGVYELLLRLPRLKPQALHLAMYGWDS